MEEDVPGRGIAMLPIQLAPADALAKGGTIFTLNNLSKLATKSFESGSGIDKGAMGTNPNLGINFNAILANPTYFNDNSTSFRIPGVAGLTRGGVIAHEAGHNSAAEFFHGNNYEYNMRGLSSNDDENIFPTKTNTFKIINDYDNRQTIPEK